MVKLIRKQRPKKQAGDDKQKVGIRLLPNIDDAIRDRFKHHGDLSAIVTEALREFVIHDPDKQLPNLRGGSGVSRATSVLLTPRVRENLVTTAHQLRRTQNAVVNGALVAWLKKH